MTRKLSQNARILNTLKTTGQITAGEARKRNIKCLTARICELRSDGVKINSVAYSANGSKATKYVLK